MNKHFEDARYYLRRTGEHVRLGLEETLEPIVEKARELTGHEAEAEAESGRVEAVLEDVKTAEVEARERLGGVRERLEGYRSSR